MSYTRRMLVRIAPIALVISLISAPGASASSTTTNTVTTQPDGGLVVTATWSYSNLELLGEGASYAAGSLVLTERRAVFCDSARAIPAGAPNRLNTPITGCQTGIQGTPAPVDVVTSTGVANTVTTTWTIPANIVAGFDADFPFIGLAYLWKESSNPNDGTWLFTPQVSISQAMSIASVGGTASATAPAKYSGPEFSSFGSATLAGNKLVTSGKKLDSITSMKINGAAVTYKINSASELEIDLPKDLAPGKYDVEINSSHGKLTHLQGITIKAVVPTKELAFKAEGAWLNYGSLLELTNVAKQIGSEYTSVKCIVNAADPVVAERLAKRACSYIEANRLRGKAVTHESKSTYKGEGFWVRVVANG